MMSTNGLPTGISFRYPSLNANVELMSPMAKDVLTSTTAITVPNENPLRESLTMNINNILTEVERLVGLLKQCNREITERLKVCKE